VDFLNTAGPRGLRVPLPLARYCYFDKTQIWLVNPLDPKDLNRLKRHCKYLYVENFCWWEWRYKQKIQLSCPDPTALGILAALDDNALLNYIEVAIDFIFRDQNEVQCWFAIFNQGFLHRGHRREMHVEAYPGGLSTRASPERGESRRGRWFNYYADKPCRITGELHCFHFEGKYCGVQFSRRIGIHHPRDLVGFNFHGFFKKDMLLYDLDIERLGRHHDNKRSCRKRKKSRVSRYCDGRFLYNHDVDLGGALYRVYALHPDEHDNPEQPRSLQQFVDSYGRGPFLTPIPIYDHVHKHLTSS
jgi:hypothetical protein